MTRFENNDKFVAKPVPTMDYSGIFINGNIPS